MFTVRNFKIILILLFVFTNNISFSVDKNKESRFEKLDLFNKVLYLVESQYYRKVDSEKLIEGAIKGRVVIDVNNWHSRNV